VFVTGFPRSGTTLLQRLIGSHPNIAAAPEIHFFSRIHDFADYWGDLSDDSTLRRVVHELCDLPDLVAPTTFDEDAVFARVAPTGRTYRDLLGGLMALIAEDGGKPRWSEKTPAQQAGRIWHLFPEAQVVHIVRDVRDVICSVRAAPWTHPTARTADIAVEWARFTVDTIQTGAGKGPEHYSMVRYEDLTRAPEAVMRSVFSFLGEDFSPSMLEGGGWSRSLMGEANWWQARAREAVQSGPDQAWRANLSTADQARAWAAARHVLTGLGYPAQRRSLGAAGSVLLVAPDLRRRWRTWSVGRRTRTPEGRRRVFVDYVDRQLGRAAAAGGPAGGPVRQG
jgi:hypothetical protein